MEKKLSHFVLFLMLNACTNPTYIADPVYEMHYDIKLRNNKLKEPNLRDSGNCMIEVSILNNKVYKTSIKIINFKKIKCNSPISCNQYIEKNHLNDIFDNFVRKNIDIKKNNKYAELEKQMLFIWVNKL